MQRTPPVDRDPAGTRLLADAVAVSHDLGSAPGFCLAGGGNSSVKVGGVLHIKPSGVSLSGLSAADLIPLDHARLLAALDEPEPAAGSDPVLRIARAARRSPDDGRRPSVELLFHALLPRTFVVHTHPTVVNTVTCSVRGPELARQLLGDAMWIPYTDPGLPLARRIRDARVAALEQTGEAAPDILLLQNHGLIVAGDDAADVARRSRGVVDRIASHAATLPPFSWGDVRSPGERRGPALVTAVVRTLARRLATGGAAANVVHDGSPTALGVAGSRLGRMFATGGPLTPDQIVYAGSWPLVVDADGLDGDDPATLLARLADALDDRAALGLEPPIIVLAGGLGLFAVGRTGRDAATARDVFLDATAIACGAHRLGGVRPLAPEERSFIETWEAEAYRRQVAAGRTG